MIRKMTNLALVLKKIFGMLSVNGYKGDVLYHDRHVVYVRNLEER